VLNVPQRAVSGTAAAVSAEDQRRILALSGERARARAREAAAFRAGYQAGAGQVWAQAWEAGYRECERDDWRARSALAEPLLHPGAVAARLLQAAESHARREADAHWHDFIRRSHDTPDRARTDVQRAVVRAGLAGGSR
jgi:hypothetical protein